MLGSVTIFGALSRRFSIINPWLWSTGAAQVVATPQRRGRPSRAMFTAPEPDWDLVRDTAAVPPIQGRVMHLFGQVINFDGAPQPDVTVEIWQSDPDAGAWFTGYGATRTDRFGGYRFRTLLPVGDQACPPCIDARLTPARGRVLNTRLYLVDDPRNDRDWTFASLGPSRQAAVTLDPVNRADGDLETGFNFVL